jgi:hypothetical protein
MLGIKPEWVRYSNDELGSATKDNRSADFVKSTVGIKFDALNRRIATFTSVQVLGLTEDLAPLQAAGGLLIIGSEHALMTAGGADISKEFETLHSAGEALK